MFIVTANRQPTRMNLRSDTAGRLLTRTLNVLQHFRLIFVAGVIFVLLLMITGLEPFVVQELKALTDAFGLLRVFMRTLIRSLN